MRRIGYFSIIIIILFIRIISYAQDKNEQLAQLSPGSYSYIGTFSGIGMEGRISLDLRNIEIIEALKYLSMKAGINIVPTQKVTGRVTLRVENVPIRDVFDIMLRSNNLAYDKKGEIYNVMTEEEYRALYGKNFSDMRQVKVFRLKYAIPEQAFSLLDTIKSGIGRLLVEPDSGTVLLMDTPEKIIEAEKALETLEQKGVIKVFNLKYAKAKDIEEQLKYQLDIKKVGSIKADERTNQVIIQALPERIEDIEKLIMSLDKKTKGVLINTKIIKIVLRNDLETGIQWEGLFNIAKRYGMAYLGSYPFSAIQAATSSWRPRTKVLEDMANNIGSYPFSGTTSEYAATKVYPGERLHIGIIDRKRDFDVLVKYLQTLGKTKIISNPSLAVINNQEAKIHIGEKRAYVTTTETVGAGTKTTSEEVEYVEVGIKLFVTPTINEDGYVTIKIKPEISSITGSIETSKGNRIPIIDTSTAETTVIVKDGATIILGGLGKEEKTEEARQVPLLGKLPILGLFFRDKTQSSERVELLILLTPIVFEGDTLITPQDKDREVFGIKPVKKFDVFKEEGRREDIENIQEKIELLPKGFRTYPE